MHESPDKPRLLWITGRYPPQKGGMAVSCDRIVQGLRRRGYPLDVVAFTSEPGAKIISQKERDNGADIHVSRQAAPGNSAQMAFTLCNNRHRERPYSRVAAFGCNLPGFIAVTYAAWLQVPSLVLVRGNDFDRDWFDPRRGLWAREALSRADAIGAVSREKVARIKALFPGADARWSPNGVDPAEWEPLAPDRAVRDEIRDELATGGRRVVGLFGELKFKKRIPLWLGALRDAGLVGKVSLLVVGRVLEDTEQILADPALSPPHKRVSFKDRDRMPGLYAACDYVAVPSLFEGMPNVLLEAMAAGVVPIASDAGAMPDVIAHGETGFMFPAEDREAAARATFEALSLSHRELADMKARARESVAREFTIGRELDRVLELMGLSETARPGGG